MICACITRWGTWPGAPRLAFSRRGM